MADYFSDDDRFLQYHYLVNSIEILFPDGADYDCVELPTERVTSFSLVHDYENNIFPIFRLTMTLTSDQYWQILKWAKGEGAESEDESGEDIFRLRFRIEIRKFYRVVGSTTRSETTSRVFKDTFYLILDDEEYDSETGFKEQEEINEMFSLRSEDNSDDLFDIKNNMEFFLFRVKDIKTSRKVISTVLHESTVGNAVNYILTKATATKKVLMSIPDDRGTGNEKIDELVIPPLPIYQALSFVDSYYGLYEPGSMIYADFDRLYILKYGYECDAYETNEYQKVTIMIPKKGGGYQQEMCYVDKADNANQVYYMIGNNDTLDIKNEATTSDVLYGNDIASMDSYTGIASDDKTSAVTAGGSTERNVNNYTENPFFTTTYTAQSTALGAVLTVELGHVDINMLKPNKQFNIIFQDTAMNKKYKGYYKMTNAQFTFIKHGDAFDMSALITLKCMKSLVSSTSVS